MSFLTKIFGDPNAKAVAALQPNVQKINDLEPAFAALSEEALKAKTAEFKARLQNGETLDDLLPEAFATVREAAKRVANMRHYDVQLIGGMVLHKGSIAEMRTGEGKTLTATLPTYLNALAGNGVHVVTVNDYLARRDAVWMGQIYAYLGMSTGVIQNQRVTYVYDAGFAATTPAEKADTAEGGEKDKERDDMGSFKVEYEFLRPASRQEAYRCDITYGTNNEYGFDYLRDNMVQRVSDMVMRPGHEMHYAIVDEVDSILIDEARTPLIISAPSNEATDQYYRYAELVRNLRKETDYNVDEKLRAVSLTEEGIKKFEGYLGVDNIYAEGGIRMVHHIEQALKAEVLFKRDKEYVVQQGEVVIIDEFTGRKMPGRRYSEGLHQAIEAKEGVAIQKESQTLATITFQNLFRMYKKLSGMTGTAATEAEELGKIYNIEVVTIPTNKPDRRTDHPDRIYKTEQEKYKAVAEKVKECRAKGQPILIGTASVERNEFLSAYLLAQGIQHEVLNAKNHEREGEIIAQAGRPGAVTLATNMAGRGVDIKLGGVPYQKEDEAKVLAAGGLFVLGTERHESRRIDNQLRGRSARQGDPGETQFFISTDDDLMRIFAGERMKSVMTRLNVPDDMPIEQPMLTRILSGAQRKVESHYFDMRKHLLEYDDVLNRHRDVIYKKRRQILELISDGADTSDTRPSKGMILDYIQKELEMVVGFHTNTENGEWNVTEIYETARTIFPITDLQKETLLSMREKSDGKLADVEMREKMVEYLFGLAVEAYGNLQKLLIGVSGSEDSARATLRDIETGVLIRAIDTLWVDHLVSIDHLRAGIGLRGYGQRDPLVEYKKETFRMFNELLTNIQKEVVYTFFKVNIGIQAAPTIMATDTLTLSGAKKENGPPPEAAGATDPKKEIGRNDPCYCGSGKKFKKCHGA